MAEVRTDFDNPTPVYLLTAVLALGRTTLLNRVLWVDGRRTAAVEMSGGCINCEPGNDIVSIVPRLSEAIDDGEVRAVDLVAIETTGLADPRPTAHPPIHGATMHRRSPGSDT